MRKLVNKLTLLAFAVALSPLMAFAEGEAVTKDWSVYIGAAVVMALAAVAGTTAQGKAVATCLEYIGRNPESKDSVFVPMILGLAMIESLVVLSFVIAILILG